MASAPLPSLTYGPRGLGTLSETGHGARPPPTVSVHLGGVAEKEDQGVRAPGIRRDAALPRGAWSSFRGQRPRRPSRPYVQPLGGAAQRTVRPGAVHSPDQRQPHHPGRGDRDRW